MGVVVIGRRDARRRRRFYAKCGIEERPGLAVAWRVLVAVLAALALAFVLGGAWFGR